MKTHQSAHQSGVTLIEVCVVLAIVAILYAQAAPNFSAWIQNAQTRTATESIQNGLQLARAEAIRRNRSVIFWLTSTANPQGADWLVGCAVPQGTGAQPEATGDCPGLDPAAGVSPSFDGSHFNWVQWHVAAQDQVPNARVSTPNGATWVTFNSLGLVIPNLNGSASVAEIDVSNAQLTGALARPLEVLVSGGQIRMCDPNLSMASDPRGCS